MGFIIYVCIICLREDIQSLRSMVQLLTQSTNDIVTRLNEQDALNRLHATQIRERMTDSGNFGIDNSQPRLDARLRQTNNDDQVTNRNYVQSLQDLASQHAPFAAYSSSSSNIHARRHDSLGHHDYAAASQDQPAHSHASAQDLPTRSHNNQQHTALSSRGADTSQHRNSILMQHLLRRPAPYPTLSALRDLPPIDQMLPAHLYASGTLPPLPQRILRQIIRGEYVSLDAILAATSAAAASRSSDERPFSLSLGRDDYGEPCMDVVHRTSLQHKVRDLHSWLTAFTWYARAVSHFHPHLMADLMRYQGIIISFAGNYAGPSWIAYDRAFRQHVANNPDVPWTKVDEELFSIFLRSAPARDACYSCSGMGHIAQHCPSVSTAQRSSHAPRSRAQGAPSQSVPPRCATSTTATITIPSTSVARTSTGFCFRFNQRGSCDFPECQFSHTCMHCNGAHSFVACPRLSTSSS